MNGNGKVKYLAPVLITVLLIMIAIPLMSFISSRRRLMAGGSVSEDEDSFAPPMRRGYLGPGPGPAPAPPAPAPAPGPHHHGHHRPYPYPYYGGWYGYPYTDALVLNALASETAQRSCYKEIQVRTEGYGVRTLCLTRDEYITRLKKEINKSRTEYEDAIKKIRPLKARQAKNRVARLTTELRAEIGY